MFSRGLPKVTLGRILFGGLALHLLFWAHSSGVYAHPPTQSIADLASRLLPSVVNISTTQVRKADEQSAPKMPRVPEGSPFRDFFKEFFDKQQKGMPSRRAMSLGSGFIIDTRGYVVTNNHVIAEADEITVTLHDDTKLAAKIVGRDPKTDLALLKVEPQKKKLAAIQFGDSGKTRVGDWVIAIGNPFGLGGTVTAGIVSARQRDIRAGPYDDFIQTDASINRGNSGGPMFNMKGRVVGINTAILSPSGGSVGIGFAIPANLARPIIEQLQKYGKARRGWLGVRIQTVTNEIAQSLGLQKSEGALVASLTQGGPAEKYNIKVGDVILRFDGKLVGSMRRLPRIVAETSVGKAVNVEIWRQRRKVTLRVKLGEFPENQGKLVNQSTTRPKTNIAHTSVPALGLSLSAITPQLRKKFKLKKTAKGVLITKVVPGGPAAEKGITPGAIVRKIGSDQLVAVSASQVKKLVEAAVKARTKTILILIESAGTQRFVALNIAKG